MPRQPKQIFSFEKNSPKNHVSGNFRAPPPSNNGVKPSCCGYFTTTYICFQAETPLFLQFVRTNRFDHIEKITLNAADYARLFPTLPTLWRKNVAKTSPAALFACQNSNVVAKNITSLHLGTQKTSPQGEIRTGTKKVKNKMFQFFADKKIYGCLTATRLRLFCGKPVFKNLNGLNFCRTFFFNKFL